MIRRLALSLSLSVLSACFSMGDSARLREADELATQEKWDEAIEAYQEHIQERLEVSDRPDWENPYFYLLTIGDVELKRGEPTKALQRYEEAEKQGVASSLVSDRYRAVAAWYEEHGNLDEAIKVLTTYRERDSLIFDAMLDRLARKLTQQEATSSVRADTSPTVAPSPSAHPH
jgi:tetratricopeptide (TPR) repeat protein